MRNGTQNYYKTILAHYLHYLYCLWNAMLSNIQRFIPDYFRLIGSQRGGITSTFSHEKIAERFLIPIIKKKEETNIQICNILCKLYIDVLWFNMGLSIGLTFVNIRAKTVLYRKESEMIWRIPAHVLLQRECVGVKLYWAGRICRNATMINGRWIIHTRRLLCLLSPFPELLAQIFWFLWIITYNNKIMREM